MIFDLQKHLFVLKLLLERLLQAKVSVRENKL